LYRSHDTGFDGINIGGKRLRETISINPKEAIGVRWANGRSACRRRSLFP
jgi:hypothetical protein